MARELLIATVARWAGLVHFGSVEHVKKRFAGCQARQQRYFCGQHSGASDEDDPAFEHMQEAVSVLRPQ